MTSQIILINQEGIAVASDTMTTAGRKAMPVASKIYEVGGEHRVCVLHSGRVEIGGVAMSTLIREWAAQLKVPFMALSDYVSDFDKWLLTGLSKFNVSEKNSIEAVIKAEFSDYLHYGDFDDIFHDHEFMASLQDENGEALEDAEDRLTERVANTLAGYGEKYFKKAPKYEDLDAEKTARMIRNEDIDLADIFRKVVHSHSDGELSDFPVNETLLNSLRGFAAELLCHRVIANETATLNFVGFGLNEPIGGNIRVDIRGIYGNHLRGRIQQRNPKSSGDLGVTIIPVAQREAMDFLVDGLNDRTIRAIQREIHCVFRELGIEPIDKLENFEDVFVKHLKELLHDEVNHPVRETISSLNVGALARYADSLIRMESLRASSERSVTSVGGAIEVVTITRWQTPSVQWHRKLDSGIERDSRLSQI